VTVISSSVGGSLLHETLASNLFHTELLLPFLPPEFDGRGMAVERVRPPADL
jgi:hypothetical protein